MYKLILLFTLAVYSSFGQAFFNGSFESNLVLNDTINLSNTAFGQKMNFCASFGTQAGLDILTDNYCFIGSQSGNWFIGMSGGGSDAFSLEVNTNLIQGQLYQISFYDRFCPLANVPKAWPAMLGLSTNNLSFGAVIFSDTTAIPITIWTKRTFSFVAPNNGKFITVKMNGGSFENGWILVDNFSFESPTVIAGDKENSFVINIFPNPFQNKIHIQYESRRSANGRVAIVNIFGQEIIQMDNITSNREIDLSFLPSGVYFLNIINAYECGAYKIVKE